jgi:Flp pilus assembly pilin Flp
MKHITRLTALVYSLLHAVLTPAAPQLAPARVASRRRGAGMLEYALVALISIAVFGVLVTQFSDILSKLAKSIGDKLTSIAG